MIDLLLLVPYPEMKGKAEFVLQNHPERDRLRVDIQVVTVEQTPEIDLHKYDAIIARGYTAKRFHDGYPQIPTIDLAISGYDIVRSIMECREEYHPKKIAICGFYGKLYEAKYICQVFGCEAEVYTPESYKEIEEAVEKIRAAGCDALIGGFTAGTIASRCGIRTTVIKTGEDTILQAFNEAVRTVQGIRQERIRAEMYKTIIYSSKEGILYVDADGKIQVRNHAAREMNQEKNLLNKELKDVLPFLYPSYQEAMKGKGINGRIFTLPGTKVRVSAELTPVIVKDEVSGVVLNLSDITHIQELEGQIRKKLNEKGLQAKYTFDDIVFESDIIRSTIETARKYAESESNIIIVGETGTGKELFAQSIHNASPRKNGPFVAINCAALPENLLESELFGYVEGAFTGTSKGGKMGLFEQAHGGTLFLDEVGEISATIQTKLLRVLQEKEVRRIGDNKVISVNVRIISATNKSIGKLADQGLFRRDLMYRLDVLRLFLPPLRQRENDAELLFGHLLAENQSHYMGEKQPVLSGGALTALHGYPFSGNIRELKNIVERAAVTCSDGVITREDILKALYPPDLGDMEVPEGLKTEEKKEEAERFLCKEEQEDCDAIKNALKACRGNQSRAAKLLGINRTTLWRKLQKYGIRP